MTGSVALVSQRGLPATAAVSLEGDGVAELASPGGGDNGTPTFRVARGMRGLTLSVHLVDADGAMCSGEDVAGARVELAAPGNGAAPDILQLPSGTLRAWPLSATGEAVLADVSISGAAPLGAQVVQLTCGGILFELRLHVEAGTEPRRLELSASGASVSKATGVDASGGAPPATCALITSPDGAEPVAGGIDAANRMRFSALSYKELSTSTNFFDMRECSCGGRLLGRRLLGSGSDADVFHADNLRGMEVAVKRIRAHADAYEVAEQHACGDIQHENVLPILGMLRDAGFTYIVLPLMECSLFDALEDPQRLAAQQRLVIARDIAAGLAALHGHQLAQRAHQLAARTSGRDVLTSRQDVILLRNLKPGNVLLHRPSGSWRARIAGFGCSPMLMERRTHDAPTGVTGTPCIVCPEYHASGTARPSSDMYSLGFILLQLVTGLSEKEAFEDLVVQTGERLFDRQGKLKMALYELMPSVRDALQRGSAAVPVVQQLAQSKGVEWPAPECAELWRLAALCLQPLGRDRPEAREVCAALEALLPPGVPPPGDSGPKLAVEGMKVDGALVGVPPISRQQQPLRSQQAAAQQHAAPLAQPQPLAEAAANLLCCTRLIGPAGGELVVGGGAVTLRFPAGCLSRPELFTLRLLPGSDVPSDVALSPRFSLEPHGFVFDSGRAAELTVQLTSAGPLLAADEEGGAAVLVKDSEDAPDWAIWHLATKEQADSGRIVMPVTHFSISQVVARLYARFFGVTARLVLLYPPGTLSRVANNSKLRLQLQLVPDSACDPSDRKHLLERLGGGGVGVEIGSSAFQLHKQMNRFEFCAKLPDGVFAMPEPVSFTVDGASYDFTTDWWPCDAAAPPLSCINWPVTNGANAVLLSVNGNGRPNLLLHGLIITDSGTSLRIDCICLSSSPHGLTSARMWHGSRCARTCCSGRRRRRNQPQQRGCFLPW